MEDGRLGEWAVHGGRLEAARAAFGGTPKDWLDLSTGINPHAWPGADRIEIDWRRLPDPEARAALESAAADHFGADPACVCAVPGSEVALRLLGQVLRGDAAHVVPGYGTYAEAFAQPSLIARDELDAAARRGGPILLANPNNPDGARFPAADLLLLADETGKTGGWLIVDEAFADTDDSISVAPHIGAERPLIVLRSFGKFFGLAGVRLGFVVAPPAIVAGYRRLLGDWPVSAAAIAIGTTAYRDRAWIDAMRARLVEEAAAFDRLLAGHGMTAKGACPLFRLIELADASDLFERLARRAILTRPFAYQPRWLRLGLPDGPAALDRLDRALADG